MSKENQKMEITKESILISAIRETSHEKGQESFLYLFNPRKGEMGYHLENMQLDNSIAMLTQCMRLLIEENITKNTMYSDDYKKIFSAFLEDLKSIIASHNDRFKKISNKK